MGTRPGWRPPDAEPADLARGMERERKRFMASVMVDASTWEIARTLQRTMRGEEGEGLRGAFVIDRDGAGTFLWWPARIMAHAQGLRLLGRTQGEVLEVEANVASNGTIALRWNGRGRDDGANDLVDEMLAHPSIGPLVDGCLTRRSRQILLTSDGIRLSAAPASDASLDDARQADRRAGWRAIADRAAAWTRSRRPVDADGRPVPPPASLRPLRHFLADRMDAYRLPPVPETTVDDGAVAMRWRGGGWATTITFAEHAIGIRINEDGRVRHVGPIPARTAAQVRRGLPWILDLERYGDARRGAA